MLLPPLTGVLHSTLMPRHASHQHQRHQQHCQCEHHDTSPCVYSIDRSPVVGYEPTTYGPRGERCSTFELHWPPVYMTGVLIVIPLAIAWVRPHGQHGHQHAAHNEPYHRRPLVNV